MLLQKVRLPLFIFFMAQRYPIVLYNGINCLFLIDLTSLALYPILSLAEDQTMFEAMGEKKTKHWYAH